MLILFLSLDRFFLLFLSRCSFFLAVYLTGIGLVPEAALGKEKFKDLLLSRYNGIILGYQNFASRNTIEIQKTHQKLKTKVLYSAKGTPIEILSLQNPELNQNQKKLKSL